MLRHEGTTKLHYLSPLYALLLTIFVLTDVFSTSTVTFESTLYALFSFLFWMITAMRESTFTRRAQIAIMTTLGLVATWFLTPDLMGGDLTCMIAVILAYRYGFLKRRPLMKSFLILGPLIGVRTGLFFMNEDIRLQTLINQLAIDAAAAPIIYYVFEDELIRNKRHRSELQRLHSENAPFAQFGHNTSGIVHDFKNDLSLFSTFGQLLEVTAGEPVDTSLIEKYKGYVERFRRRIERILFVSRASHSETRQRWNISEAIEATMYVYESSLTYKKLISFERSLPAERVYLSGSVFSFISIVENLIRNSCEAIANTGRPGTVTVEAVAHDRYVEVTIADSGPGIPFCEGCTAKNCLDCHKLEHVKTTKVDGSGLGLENVRNSARQLGADITIKSKKGKGATCTVLIPFEVGVDLHER